MIFTSGSEEFNSIVKTCGDSSLSGVRVILVALGLGTKTKELEKVTKDPHDHVIRGHVIFWCDNETKLVSNIMNSK